MRHPFQQQRHLGDLEAGSEIAQHRLGNNQFANKVDELVDLIGIHADRGRIGFFRLAGRLLLFLFLQRLLDLLRRDGMLLNENLADSLLLRQRMVERFARDNPSLDENLSEGFGLPSLAG